MQIELNNGKTVEFDEIAARARVHATFTELSGLLEQLMAVALIAEQECHKDVKDSHYEVSAPHYEFHNLAEEMARHIRNIKYWFDDYPLDGGNPWG